MPYSIIGVKTSSATAAALEAVRVSENGYTLSFTLPSLSFVVHRIEIDNVVVTWPSVAAPYSPVTISTDLNGDACIAIVYVNTNGINTPTSSTLVINNDGFDTTATYHVYVRYGTTPGAITDAAGRIAQIGMRLKLFSEVDGTYI